MVLARTTLWCLALSGFAVNYMVQFNMNIAIVGMIRPKHLGTGTWNHTLKNETDLGPKVSNSTEIKPTDLNATVGKPEIVNISDAGSPILTLSSSAIHFDLKNEDNLFDWDEYQQNYVLGSFFWLFWISAVPAALMARKYGTKMVFGLCNLLCSLFTLLVPLCANWSFEALVVLRVLQGIVAGLANPAMHHMAAIWIPQNERSKFMSAYLGTSLGIAVTYPLCGVILDRLSWEWVFYVTAAIGMIWCVFWYRLVYDTPAQHPTISAAEREYIFMNTGGINHKKKSLPSVPWREVLTSGSVWMNFIGQFGSCWGLFTLMTQVPTYFNVIHGINIKMNGVYSGLPHLCRFGFAYGFALFCDSLLRSGKCSKTVVRKLATTFCTVLPGLLVLGMAYSGHSIPLAVFFLVAATMVNGAVSSGPFASLVDLTPNFASIVQGLCGVIGFSPGFISPVAVAFLTSNDQTVEQWKKVFTLSAGVMVTCGVLYDIFASSELQPWNDGVKSTRKKQPEEMRIIKESAPKTEIVKHEEARKLTSNGTKEAS